MKQKLAFKELYIELKVQDIDKNIGTIKECSDIHNILVEFDNEGIGLYCFDENCEDYFDELYKL